MKLKTFKGRSKSGTITKIRLSTNQGLIGYKIRKFQTINPDPGTESVELVAQLFSVEPATATGSINFDSPTLLGISYYQDHDSSANPGSDNIIFDSVKFNQDIFLTTVDVGGTTKDTNYYIELEQVKLSQDEATVATLKNMRGRE
tara:strand:- start:97 stop:531 length:435 start_codon:yes stop_codon:yes gene_type:complete